MITRIVVSILLGAFAVPIALSLDQSAPSLNTVGQREPGKPPPAPHPGVGRNSQAKPQGVKGYLDQQLAMSKDKKFHVSLNGKDLALAPVKFHDEKKLGGGKGSTAVEMKGADGKIYEIDFVTSGTQVTGASVGKVNGKSPSSQ